MVKQPLLGPFVRNLLYNPEAKKYLKYPILTSYNMWEKYNAYRKTTGGKGITNQNWNRIIYVLKELNLITKVDKPTRFAPIRSPEGTVTMGRIKESLIPVPGPNHPSGYIPNTFIFAWEHIISDLGQITIDATNSLFNYIFTKYKIDWIYKSSIEIVDGDIDIHYNTNIIRFIRNTKMNRIEMYMGTLETEEKEEVVELIDIFSIVEKKEIHEVHFIDTRLDWKRTYYKAVPENINSESWINPQLAYRIKLNSTSFQQELATKAIERQWKGLIKEYTNIDTTAEINIDTPIPVNWSPELKDIINKKRELYIKKIIIPPRKDYVTIKVTKQLKDKIDAERGEMTISDYLETKMQ